MNLKALNCQVIAGVMKAVNPDVNMVSAPVVARERGIEISTTRQDKSGVFDGYIKLVVHTTGQERSVAGTVFAGGKPRFIQFKGINIDAEIGAHMLYTTNEDVPGIIGTLGQTLGENGVNIANFTLGRSRVGRQSDRAALSGRPAPGGCAGQGCAPPGSSPRSRPCASTPEPRVEGAATRAIPSTQRPSSLLPLAENTLGGAGAEPPLIQREVHMQDIVILGAARTAIGTFGGSLAATPPTELGRIAAAEAMARAGLDPAGIGTTIFGHVHQHRTA